MGQENGHIRNFKFEISIRSSSGNIKYAAGFQSLGREVRTEESIFE